MDDRTVSPKFLAYQWSVHPKTIRDWDWLKPAKVAPGRFDAKLAHDLYIRHRILPLHSAPEGAETGESLEEAKRRYEIARANKAELQAAQLRGNLMERGEAIQWVTALVSEARLAFLALPRRLAPVLYGKEIREIEALIREEISRILGKLSRPVKSGTGSRKK